MSFVLNARALRAADCDTGHNPMVSKDRERLSVVEQTTHRICTERFSLKKLIEVECKEQYLVEISNRFRALENLNADVDIKRAWEAIRENITISTKKSLGYYELKKRKPWFDEGWSKL
jgi:hypothetical protein